MEGSEINMERNRSKMPIENIFQSVAWLAAGSFAIDASNVLASGNSQPANYLILGAGIVLIICGLMMSVIQIKYIRPYSKKLQGILSFTEILVFPVAIGEFLKLSFGIFAKTPHSVILEIIAIGILIIFLIAMMFVLFEDWPTIFWDLGKLLQLTFAFNIYAFLLYFGQGKGLQAIIVFGISSIFTILSIVKWDNEQKVKKINLRLQLISLLQSYLRVKSGDIR